MARSASSSGRNPSQAAQLDIEEVNERPAADGYEVDPPTRQHGAWTFNFEAPGGFTVEAVC
jgi:hypothetical protein